MRLRNRRTSPASFVAAPAEAAALVANARAVSSAKPAGDRPTCTPSDTTSCRSSSRRMPAPAPGCSASRRSNSSAVGGRTRYATVGSEGSQSAPASRSAGRCASTDESGTPFARDMPGSTSASYIFFSARRPSGESRFPSLRSIPVAARRSPRVSAPSDCNRRATAAAKRRSPPRLVLHITYSGPLV